MIIPKPVRHPSLGGNGFNSPLPNLPEGLHWEIKVLPSGTYVRVSDSTASRIARDPVVESFVEDMGTCSTTVYLTHIWNAANALAHKVWNQRDRQAWIKGMWDL